MFELSSHRIAAALAAVAAVAVLAACGSSSKKTDAKLTTACKADFTIATGFDKLFNTTPALQSGKPLTKAQLPAFQASYDRLVAAPIATLQKNASPEISPDVNAAAAAAKNFRDTGDATQISSPAVQKKTSALDQFYFGKCSGQKTTIGGIDYGYTGAKPTYKAGQIRIKFENKGKEVHEISLARKKDGVTQSFAQLLKLPDSQIQPKVDLIGQTDAAPGKTSFLLANLPKGDYIMVCFIPKGTTSPNKQGKGPPHAFLGMQKEFKVQ